MARFLLRPRLSEGFVRGLRRVLFWLGQIYLLPGLQLGHLAGPSALHVGGDLAVDEPWGIDLNRYTEHKGSL